MKKPLKEQLKKIGGGHLLKEDAKVGLTVPYGEYLNEVDFDKINLQKIILNYRLIWH